MSRDLAQSAPYLLYEYQQFARQRGPNSLERFPMRKSLLNLFCDEETVHRVSREYDCLSEDQYFENLIEGCWSSFLQEDQNEMLSRLENGRSPRNQRLDYILYAGKTIKNARNTYRKFSYKMSKYANYKSLFSGGLEQMKACCFAFCFPPHDPFVVQDNLISYVKEYREIPEESQFQDADILVAQYGSWDKIIDFLRLDKMVVPNTTEEEQLALKKEYLLEQIWIKANELGRQPRFVEMDQGTTIQRTFGSWNKALIAAGYKPYVKDYNCWDLIKSNEDLEIILVEQTEYLNRLPLAREYKHLGVVIKRYGKWSEFLRVTHEHYPILWKYPEKKRSYSKIPSEEWIAMRTQASQFYERFVS